MQTKTEMTINDIERQLDFYAKAMLQTLEQLRLEEIEISYDRNTNSILVWCAKHVLDEPCSNEVRIKCQKNVDLTQVKWARERMILAWDVTTMKIITQKFDTVRSHPSLSNRFN